MCIEPKKGLLLFMCLARFRICQRLNTANFAVDVNGWKKKKQVPGIMNSRPVIGPTYGFDRATPGGVQET